MARPQRKPVELVEQDSYERSVVALGGTALVDQALSPIVDGLSCNPEGFDLVPGYEPWRIAKTRKVVRADGSSIPAMRLWFEIAEDGRVHLLWAEKAPDPDLDDVT